MAATTARRSAIVLQEEQSEIQCWVSRGLAIAPAGSDFVVVVVFVVVVAMVVVVVV